MTTSVAASSHVMLLPRTWLYENQLRINEILHRDMEDIFTEERSVTYDHLQNAMLIDTQIGVLELKESDLRTDNPQETAEMLLNLQMIVLRIVHFLKTERSFFHEAMPVIELTEDLRLLLTCVDYPDFRVVLPEKRSFLLSVLVTESEDDFYYDMFEVAERIEAISGLDKIITDACCKTLDGLDSFTIRKIKLQQS